MISAAAAVYEGASINRLTGSSWSYATEPTDDWLFNARELGNRAASLVRNDPVMAALLSSRIVGTFGNRGLVFRSLYQVDESPETTEAERKVRDQVNSWLKRCSQRAWIDAACTMTRLEFESALDGEAAIRGEAFAIRQYRPDRIGTPVGTCWQMIRTDRVSNPPGITDGKNYFQGIELDDFGAPMAIWIAPPRRAQKYQNAATAAEFIRVPWYADDGTLNVIHRVGSRVPGSPRGVSCFAPNVFLAQQIQKAIEAYVVAKRIQACHPIFIESEDPVAAAAADANGAVFGTNTRLEPGKVYYVGHGSGVHFPSWQFQGADMREFLDTLYRNQFAAWGFPVDVVLADLGKTNMAASRSAWTQFYQRCAILQDEAIAQGTSIIDQAWIREGIVRGEIDADLDNPHLFDGEYIRPPRPMPDPLKEANAAKAWSEMKRDLSGIFSESGIDFDASMKQRAQDERLMEEQGLAAEEPADEARPAAPTPEDDEEPDDKEDETEDEAPSAAAPQQLTLNFQHPEPVAAAPINVHLPKADPQKAAAGFRIERDAQGRISNVVPL
jgi:capsid protein